MQTFAEIDAVDVLVKAPASPSAHRSHQTTLDLMAGVT